MRGEAKFTEQEQRGLSLFTIRQKGNCVECHIVDAASRDSRKSLFTDFSYRALGLPRSMRIPKNADPAFIDLGLCERVPVSDAKLPAGVTPLPKDPAACGLFKTPTLRNITVTAPYMHNGFFDNLRDAVAWPHRNWRARRTLRQSKSNWAPTPMRATVRHAMARA